MVVFRTISCSIVAFHCQLLGVAAGPMKPELGAGLVVLKQPAHGSSAVSSFRMPLMFSTNGGLFPNPRTADRLLWAKNRPSPARSAVLPRPVTSHATPRRGARLL